MKKVLVLVMMVLGLVCQADLITALKTVESGNRANVVGDKGDAKGILQIHQEVITDVNRIYKKNYVHDDAFDPKKAEQICKLYLTYYGKHYEKKTGKKATAEVLARIWNGGPVGYKNKRTDGYWQKVSKIYNSKLQVVGSKVNKNGKI